MGKILIVDDAPETYRALASLFRADGHAADGLADGAGVVDAIRTARAGGGTGRPFDVVLLDVVMPRVNGLTALAAIRADPDPAVRGTPVVVYSAVTDPVVRARMAELGADAWVAKGTPPADLRARLARYFGAAGVPTSGNRD